MKDIPKILFGATIPRQKESPIVKNNIKIISLFFVGIFVLKFYDEWNLKSFMNIYTILDKVLWLLSLVVLPVGIVLFYIKKRFGWILLTSYATYSAALTIGTFISVISEETSVFALFKNAPAVLALIAYVSITLFFVIVIMMLCNKSMRRVYGSNSRIMIWIFIITTLLAYFELLYNRFL